MILGLPGGLADQRKEGVFTLTHSGETSEGAHPAFRRLGTVSDLQSGLFLSGTDGF